MNRPPETRLTPEVAREICERTGSAAVLEGSIAGLGSQYVLWLRARNCRTGEVLAEEQAQAERKEEVLNALSRIAIQMRTRLGESLASVQEHSTPLEQATTSSLEALKAYSAAKIASYAQWWSGRDPAFPAGHRHRSAIRDGACRSRVYVVEHGPNRSGSRGSPHSLRASGSRQRSGEALHPDALRPPGNRKLAEGVADSRIVGTDVSSRCLRPMALSRVGSHSAPANMKGGFKQLKRPCGWIRTSHSRMEVVAVHNLYLDRFTQAAEALQRAAERKLEIPEFLVTRYYLAFLKGDQAGMDREIARAPGEHAEDWMSHNQALVLARSGRMRQARTMWERAIALAQQAGKPETAAIYVAAEAVCEAHFGNRAAAKKRARAALELAKGRDVEYAAAFALALSGESSESQRLAADLEKRFPEDTPVQFEYLPTLHALSALAHQAPLDAVERLQRAVPYDFAMPGTAFFAKFGGLYPAYIRGEAYLAAGRGQEAAAEFQKVLNHRGIVLADPIGALAHLQLGRAYVVSGDMTKAKSAYQDFLTLWKDADADIPVLKQASAEYAKL